MTYKFEKRPRTKVSVSMVVGYLVILGLIKLTFQLADVLLALAILIAIPAIYELARNTTSTLTLSKDMLRWTTGRQTGEIAFHTIKRVRFDTRLDLSIKTTVILNTGRKIRIPYACTPPIGAFTEALNSANIKHERHHFTLIG